jgi:hypothetical protein
VEEKEMDSLKSMEPEPSRRRRSMRTSKKSQIANPARFLEIRHAIKKGSFRKSRLSLNQ